MENLSLNAALMVALSGFVTVFLMLAALSIAITLVSKIFVAIEKKSKAAQEAHTPAPAVAPAVSAPAAGGAYTGEVALIDVDEKTAACVMAIVSHETGIELNQLIFKKIKAL